MASSTPPPEPSSFTMIGDRDLEAIGAHCHYTYCNQLDFLPFRCESCKHTYCLDHRTETAHACPQAGAWAAARRAKPSMLDSPAKPTLATGTQCSHPTCKTYVNTHTSVGVACPTCNRTYCLKHRLGEDHSCKILTPVGARPAQTQKASALSRLRAWGKEKADKATAAAKPTPWPSSAAARAVQMNNLKKNAKGDAKVPIEKRIYLYVEAEALPKVTAIPRAELFFSSEWRVGRVLDEAARQLRVENVNNRGGGEVERLRVFHVEGGRVLGFGDKLGEAVKSGETIVLLRGIGDGTGPDMIET